MLVRQRPRAPAQGVGVIHAWVENGLLYVVRTDADQPAPEGRAEHAVFHSNSVFWIRNGPNGEVQPMLDIEREQINSGRAWPPPEKPVTL